MNNNTKTFAKFYTLIMILMGIISFLVIIPRILHLQFIEGDKWRALSEQVEKSRYPIEAPRGNIYSHDMRLLVTTIPSYYLRFDFKANIVLKDNGQFFYDNVDILANTLSDVYHDHDQQWYREMLIKTYKRINESKKGARTAKLNDKRISHSQMLKIKQSEAFDKKHFYHVNTLSVDTIYERRRPYGQLAQRTLGNIYSQDQYNSDLTRIYRRGSGQNGLENFFDKNLRGSDGIQQIVWAYGKDVRLNVIDPIPGNDIITTLDIDLQDIVENELEKKLRLMGGKWGCAILMEVNTGGILACANLGLASDGNYYENDNYAARRVEPGSTMKTMSIMAALEDGLIQMDDIIDTGTTGSMRLNDRVSSKEERPITDWSARFHSGFGKIRIEEALYASSNIGIAQVILNAYGKNYDKYLERLEEMGITDPRSIELNNAQEPLLKTPPAEFTFATMSYGYYAELPPIYTIRYYNAIANNGKMVRPHLCRAIAQNGKIIEEFEPEVIRNKICSNRVLKQIQSALENVVWSDKEVWFEGEQKMHRIATGTAARSKLVRIAGKTGTVQLLVNKTYSTQRHRISFCGYFPVEDPKYTCLVVIHDPVSPGAGGSDCAVVVKNIAERTISLKQRRTPQQIAAINNGAQGLPSIKTGYEQAIYQVQKEIDISREDVTAKKRGTRILSFQTSTENGGHLQTSERKINTDNGLVPNVLGMGAKDAVYLLERTGMSVNMHGAGKVVAQSIAPGTKTKKGTIINITLR
ncbi:MAG TPA: hypothetical protein DEO38_03200 [Bacteroidales bacterium]|nr:hypothetical protein [Bacteroidales bacterium]